MITAFAACSDNSEENHNGQAGSEKAKRTVIVYMSAENDLHSFATADLREMATGSKSIGNDVNLIVFVDLANNKSKPYVARMHNGNQTIDTEYNPTSDFYASDPDKMRETLNWIINKYPADDYGLILWGHATGWFVEDSVDTKGQAGMRHKAYGCDSGNNTQSLAGGKWINIPSLAKVLGGLDGKLLYIFADCCCFQTAEVAYELRHSAEYIIGSPAEIPGYGANYSKIAASLFSKSPDFYKDIANNYGYTVPLSVIKTSEMESFAKATAIAMADTKKEADADFNDLIYYLFRKYGRVNFDIKNFMQQNTQNQETYLEWEKALDKAVVFKKKAERWDTNGHVDFYDFKVTDDNYGGMSMFVPRIVYQQVFGKDWNKTIAQMQWYYAAGIEIY